MANAGYVFVKWTEGGVAVSPSASYKFALTASRNLVANFRRIADLNGDGCIDRTDLNLLLTKIRARSTDLTYDLNGDGKVDIADARFLVLQFTNPGGAPCLPAKPILLKRSQVMRQN
jgi:hypothetical protein